MGQIWGIERIQKMRLIIKRIKVVIMVAVVMLTTVLPVIPVYAASGKTTIAVSSGEVKVGEEVSVTVKVKTEAGNTAKAKVKLSYDEDVLEFVSCSVTHDGGAGGSVTATASAMTVKFNAVAEGRGSLIVDASNGVEASSGSGLSSVEGCSTNITVKAAANAGTSGNMSADNSLKELILSEGALSPAFAGNVVNYTASVPGNVTEVEVEAATSNRNATIESITGNTDLQVGLNTIKVVVKAENGALATYTIELTREAEELPVSTETEAATTEEIENTTNEELEEALERNEFLSNSYKQLEEKYQKEKEFSRSVIYALIFVIAILVVIIINLIALYRREADEEFDDSFERKKMESKPVSKTKGSKIEEPIVKAEKAAPKTEKIIAREEKTSVKIEKTSAKAEVKNDFEVLDFNDED